MSKEEMAIEYIKKYRELDEKLYNTAPKGTVSSIATKKCLEFWDMAIEALEQKQKILNALDFAIKASDGDTNYFVGFRNGMRYVKSLIDGEEPQFESCAEQESKTGHWIPVSEKLPEEYIACLCTIRNHETFNNCLEVYNHAIQYDPDSKEWLDEDMSSLYYEVIAWMPLPKPYKAEGEE